MRVLFAVHLWPPGHNAGAETMAVALAGALVAQGHQVSVQLSMAHPMFSLDPYNYRGVGVWPYQRQDDLWRWVHGDSPPDLIVSHLDTAVQAMMLGQVTRIPVVLLIHNTHDLTRREIVRGPALAVFNTHWMRENFEQSWDDTLGPMPRHIVIHPPIDVAAYRTVPGSAGTGRITLVNVTKDKGAEVFYALAQRLPQRKFLGVCGAYGDQILRYDLPNVEIIAHVPAHDMPASVYSRTRVLLAPSSYESYGRVTVEAACSGIPSIAHPTPGLLEALGDGGTFCDRDDLDAWVAALKSLGTARGWVPASARATAVADRLNTDADLLRWVQTAEVVAGVTAPAGATV